MTLEDIREINVLNYRRAICSRANIDRLEAGHPKRELGRYQGVQARYDG